MSDAELWAAWRMWIVVATIVVLLAAGLLITILITARRILAEAVRALNAVEVIRANTQPIWELKATNEVAQQILETVEAIEQKGGALVGALAGQPALEGRTGGRDFDRAGDQGQPPSGRK